MGAHFSRICLVFRLPFFKYQNCKKMSFLRLSLFPRRARNGRTWSRPRRRRGRRPHEVQETFWDSFGSRSSFKRASRSLAKTGLFFGVFFVFFSACFLRLLFSGFSVFGSLWRSQRGSFLEHFCKKTCFLAKKGDLCFCTPLQRFGLILRV